jgi:hypothetical protein
VVLIATTTRVDEKADQAFQGEFFVVFLPKKKM